MNQQISEDPYSRFLPALSPLQGRPNAGTSGRGARGRASSDFEFDPSDIVDVTPEEEQVRADAAPAYNRRSVSEADGNRQYEQQYRFNGEKRNLNTGYETRSAAFTYERNAVAPGGSNHLGGSLDLVA